MKYILLFLGILAFGGPDGSCRLDEKSLVNGADVVWLGKLPPDEFYSTRVLSISKVQSVVVTEDTILRSQDSGIKWEVQAKAKKADGPTEFDQAWFDSVKRLYVLSGHAVFVSSDLGSTWKLIDKESGGTTYAAITGNSQRGSMIVVGGRSVSIPHERWLELPNYAEDKTDSSPDRMLVPAISISNDEGHTWHAAQLPSAMGYLDGVRLSGSYGVAWGPYAVYVSSTGGLSWRRMRMNLPEDEDDAYPVSATIAGKTVRVSLMNGRMLAGPLTGSRLSALVQLSSPLRNLSFLDSCVGFGVSSLEGAGPEGEGDSLMLTKDGGTTWTSVLRSKAIVALTASGSDLYGATANRAFRIHVNQARLADFCAR